MLTVFSATHLGGFGGAAATDEEDEDALMQRALEMSMREMLSVNDAGSAEVSAGGETKSEADEVRVTLCCDAP